ncbi:MAG: hypothetical protein V1895_02725 [Parcubacteria group bacterium]
MLALYTMFSSAFSSRRIALVFGLGFVVLVALGTLGGAFVVNSIQEVRRTRTLEEARQRGETLDPQELERRFPSIDIF